MALSKNINLYEDVRSILDAALENLPARLTFNTRGKAIQWRQRAYYFRVLLFNKAAEQFELLPGHRPKTAYDHLVLRLESDPSTTVVIEQVNALAEATFTDAEGNPIELTTLQPGADEELDELLSEALDIVEKQK